jgi:hypothetical protein
MISGEEDSSCFLSVSVPDAGCDSSLGDCPLPQGPSQFRRRWPRLSLPRPRLRFRSGSLSSNLWLQAR